MNAGARSPFPIAAAMLIVAIVSSAGEAIATASKTAARAASKPEASTATTATAPAVGGTCLPAQATAGPGVVDPFHVPADAAKQLNADGSALYRQGHWEEARVKFRAAEAADPDFLAPALNVACSFVRQERFADAVAEVLRLLDRAYLPWSDEVLTAADLGALKVRPEGKPVRAALDTDRLRWAERLADDVILVARTRAPLKLGDADPAGGAGSSAHVLGPRQELFAWSPRTRRYRQITAEQGRVLVVARSRDGRRVAFATAEKLIRTPGAPSALRGITLKEVELGTLSVVAQARVDGDVQRLAVLPVGAGFAYRIERGAAGAATFVVRDGRLDPTPVGRDARPTVVLTGRGASTPETSSSSSSSSPSRGAGAGAPLPGGCSGTARDVRGADGIPGVEIRSPTRNAVPIVISGPFGGSLAGLPIP